MENRDGYGVSLTNHDYGSDIQSVAGSFGGGAICLFEYPEKPDSVSTPRFTPVQAEQRPGEIWNAGPISDTRYAYEVIVNGPMRSIIKIKTMNWNTGSGSYEVEQYYTAHAHQSYSTCKVIYKLFAPAKEGVLMGCGIRKKPEEEWGIRKDNLVISAGPELIRDPEKIDNREDFRIDFIGSAVVVKDKYKPEYQFIPGRDGNHALKINSPENNSFEYFISSAWSEGAVLNNYEDYEAYIRKSSDEFNNPVIPRYVRSEEKK
jgi:hypothetical protein